MSDAFFNPQINDDDFGKMPSSKPPSKIWIIISIVLFLVVGGLVFLLLQKPVEVVPDTSSEMIEFGKDVKYSNLSNIVHDSFVNFIFYFTTGDDEYRERFKSFCTKECLNNVTIMSKNPKLRDLIKSKQITPEPIINKPEFINYDKKSQVITFKIDGKIIVKSPITRFPSHTRYFSSVVKLVKEKEGYKVANFKPEFSF